MAIKQFALPLNDASLQTGDTNLKKLYDAGQPVLLKLSNIASGTINQLNLITSRNDTRTDHVFAVVTADSSASVTLSVSQLAALLNDATAGDWDYVEAYWTVGMVDVQQASIMTETQSGRVFDTHGWPPNK